MVSLKTFHEAVKKGDLPAVQSAVAEDPTLPSQLNEAGQSAFLLAKYYRQEPIAAYLYQAHPDLDIFEASAGGYQQLVEKLLGEHPELLAARSSDGWTPLHVAAFFGHPELARYLIDHGATVDARSTNAMKNTPLHAAAAGAAVPVVRLLLERGADVNATQEGGWTALHSAAQAGNRELIEALLASNANVKVRALNNQSPIDLALLSGHGEIAELLEQLGGSAA